MSGIRSLPSPRPPKRPSAGTRSRSVDRHGSLALSVQAKPGRHSEPFFGKRFFSSRHWTSPPISLVSPGLLAEQTYSPVSSNRLQSDQPNRASWEVTVCAPERENQRQPPEARNVPFTLRNLPLHADQAAGQAAGQDTGPTGTGWRRPAAGNPVAAVDIHSARSTP